MVKETILDQFIMSPGLKQNSERFIEGKHLAERVERGAVLLDIRQPQQFASGHLAGSLSIAFHPVGYAGQVNFFVPPARPLVLVCESVPERLAATFGLAQAGYNILGYTELTPDLPLETIRQLSIDELWREISRGSLHRNLSVVDIRSQAEWDEYHIEGAIHLPYPEVPRRLHDLDKPNEIVVVAATRYHSLTVISFLKQHGFDRLHEVPAGMSGWARSGLPIKRGS